MTFAEKGFIVVGLVGSLLIVAPMGYADIIEVRGKGIMNGKALSQDEKETHFSDKAGNIQVFAAKDVLMFVSEAEKTITESLKEEAGRLLDIKMPKVTMPKINSEPSGRRSSAATNSEGYTMAEVVQQVKESNEKIDSQKRRVMLEQAAIEAPMPVEKPSRLRSLAND